MYIIQDALWDAVYVKKCRFLANRSFGNYLTLTTLWANSADDKLMIFSYFRRKQGLAFHANCLQLSPLETICMKCQNLLYGKNKKNILVCCLLKFLFRVLSIKLQNQLPSLKIINDGINDYQPPDWSIILMS